jgi:hypothetical protein
MTPVETAQLVALVASICTSMHLEETTTKTWHALLADLDVADANAAMIQLGRRQRHIAAADIRNEVRAIWEQRLARDPLPLPDADPDNPRHYRAELLDIVAAITSGRRVRRVPTTPPSRIPTLRPFEARPPQPFSPRGLPVVQSTSAIRASSRSSASRWRTLRPTGQDSSRPDLPKEGGRPGSEGEGTPVPPKRQTCRRAYVRSCTSHGRRDRHHRRRQPDR